MLVLIEKTENGYRASSSKSLEAEERQVEIAERRQILPVEIPDKPRIASPRLVDIEDSSHFQMTMTDEKDDIS
jgi:hypothetical protein